MAKLVAKITLDAPRAAGDLLPGLTVPFQTLWLLGASTGMGRETALLLAKKGVTVFASARNVAGLESLAAAAPAGRIIPLPLDATDAEAVRAAYAQIKAQVGRLDAALYGAATWAPESTGLDPAAVRRVFDTNFFAALTFIDTVLPDMRAAGRGRIAVISSVAGYRGLPRAAAYGSSKAALTHMAEVLRLSCTREGIVVQCIQPGFVKTPLTDKNDFPMPFLMSAAAAAERIVAGLCGRQFEITFPKRFTYLVKLLRLLPYGAYFPLLQRVNK